MKKYVAGFVGAGKMGSALASAVIKKIGSDKVIVSCSRAESSGKAASALGCEWNGPKNVVSCSRYIFIGVKPQSAAAVIMELCDSIRANEDCIIISMMAGVPTEKLKELTGCDKIIRIMPNIPVSVGEGMTLVSKSDAVSERELSDFVSLLEYSGKISVVPEALIDAGSALSGCGPAFVYMFLQALADGGVKCGLQRKDAILYAAQTLIGAARLALESKEHPDKLKDDVCSPGGSTIEGVSVLENGALRGNVINAVCASYEKTKKLANNK